ncbi:MAG: HAMP domain-containing histidine kinase [Propionibacteriaceae bacterium]|jgi:signal transduction histidine kinase|nr:HAMP domain-containing histidine kinase [Propionibacteriaceae bacterium]
MSGWEARKPNRIGGGPRGRVFSSVVFLLTFGVMQLAGYFILQFVFQFTGKPPEALAYVLSALLGVVLLVAVVGLIVTISGNGGKWRQFKALHSRFTDVLAQIAQGNFNVLIDMTEAEVNLEFADGYLELATAINDMARSLGSLETMRQDFISNVSHEIQSPLTSIGGFAALLKDDALTAAERRRYAETIETESKRLSSLSDNLLKLSALDDSPLVKTEFRLDKQLSNIILTLEPQWSAKNLTVVADLDNCVTTGDENLLSQVWINLLGNAIKFTSVNGAIQVMLNGNTVKIADNGIGMAKADLPHIFERFYKVDKARDRSLGGNGLGLSLVKRIVELHDGSITVNSEVGIGTTFEILLPGNLQSV